MAIHKVEVLYSFNHSNAKYFVVRYIKSGKISIFCNLLVNYDMKVVRTFTEYNGLYGLDLELLNDICDITGRSWRHHVNNGILSIMSTELNYMDLHKFIGSLNRYLSTLFDDLNKDAIRMECGIMPDVKYETCLVPSIKNKKKHNFKVFLGDTVLIHLSGGRSIKGVVLSFREEGICMKDGSFIYLRDIKDIQVIKRNDGDNLDWR